MNPRIFRENDVRGRADVELDDATVDALGEALGQRAAALSDAPRAVVGRDGRLHSPRLAATLIAALRRRCEVIDLGVAPTPLVSFACQRLAAPVAVMVTGSHNPPEDNGFKISVGGDSLHGAAIAALRDDVAALAAAGAAPAPPRLHAVHERALEDDYLRAALAALRPGPRRLRVVVDGGNGAGGPLAVRLLRALGFEVTPLYCEIDGRFPHHHPDPTIEENLRDLADAVVATGAELGIGLDGDGDRIGVVDARRRVVWGDQLLILLGRALLEERPRARLLAEVKCSQATFEALRAAGGEIEMWKVGHSLLKARMRETGALLAGEMSGHFFFADRWLGFDDGLYAGARLLELLSRGEETLSDLVDRLPETFNTPELRRPCADARKASVVADVAGALRGHPDVRAVIEIDGVRASFDGGWALLRASTTQPLVVLRYEADSPARLAEIRALMDDLVEPKLAAPRSDAPADPGAQPPLTPRG
ncbi:MAG: phosphomannomutase/phosphoglucomutase [Kofleriaceae bacterium]